LSDFNTSETDQEAEPAAVADRWRAARNHLERLKTEPSSARAMDEAMLLYADALKRLADK
jgi:hypothetical protein